MWNLEATIISQYANSTGLVALLGVLNDAIDPSPELDAFYNLVWNVDTAQGYGLDVWGRIVDVERVLQVKEDEPWFGFWEQSEARNDAPFYSGLPAASTNYRLDDTAFRRVILIKAAANIYPTTAPALNTLLANLYTGKAYVNDYGFMLMRYNFEFYLAPFEISLLVNSNVFPKPTGVKVFYTQIPPQTTFGFNVPGYDFLPFGEGPLFNSASDLLTD